MKAGRDRGSGCMATWRGAPPCAHGVAVLVVVLAGLLALPGSVAAAETPGTITEFPLAEAGPTYITEADGALWVTDRGREAKGIVEMSVNGLVIKELPIGGETEPWAISAGPEGSVWYTTQDPATVNEIDSSGDVLRTVSLSSEPDSQAAGVAEGAEEDMWVSVMTGAGAEMVQVNQEGAVVKRFLLAGGAEGIALGPEKDLWFTENSANEIGRISPSGTIKEFPVPTGESFVRGIAAGPEGNLWFTEQGADKIGRITPAGAITEFPIPTPESQPVDIAAGPDGNLWFTETVADRIGRITPAGVISEFRLPAAAALPWGITAGPNGNLWFAMERGIGEIVPGGEGEAPGSGGSGGSGSGGSSGSSGGSSGSSGPEATASAVSCALQVSAAEDVCTFTVHDAGSGSVGPPTGSVEFELGGHGDQFGTGGPSCVLAPPPRTSGASACSVRVIPATPDYAPTEALRLVARDAEAYASAIEGAAEAAEHASASSWSVDALRGLAKQFRSHVGVVETYAEQLRHAIESGNTATINAQAMSVSESVLFWLQALGAALNETEWVGPDANRVRSEFEDRFVPAATSAANAIRALQSLLPRLGGRYEGDAKHAPSDASVALPPITNLAADAQVSGAGVVSALSASIPVSCQFACVITAELLAQASGASAARSTHSKAKKRKRRRPRPLVLGKGSVRLSKPGAGRLLIKLSRNGRARLGTLKHGARRAELMLTIATARGAIVTTKSEVVLLHPKRKHRKP